MENKDKNEVIFSKREFLNLPGHHSMANIVASITKYRDEDVEKGQRWIDIHLGIADCNRTITLSIDYDGEEDRKNALHKVDTLIDTLTEFREALEKELKYQARLERRRNRLKAEEEAKKKK